jgi:hypothetical protein
MEERKIIEVRDQPARSVEPEVVERIVFVRDRRPRFVLGLVVGAAMLAASVWSLGRPPANNVLADATRAEQVAR